MVSVSIVLYNDQTHTPVFNLQVEMVLVVSMKLLVRQNSSPMRKGSPAWRTFSGRRGGIG